MTQSFMLPDLVLIGSPTYSSIFRLSASSPLATSPAARKR
jgi:hypothetical protein